MALLALSSLPNPRGGGLSPVTVLPLGLQQALILAVEEGFDDFPPFFVGRQIAYDGGPLGHAHGEIPGALLPKVLHLVEPAPFWSAARVISMTLDPHYSHLEMVFLLPWSRGGTGEPQALQLLLRFRRHHQGFVLIAWQTRFTQSI
jgi:hypothetical protein